MHAELLDVTEHKEGVLYHSLLDNLLQVLTLNQEFIELLLHIAERKPDD